MTGSGRIFPQRHSHAIPIMRSRGMADLNFSLLQDSSKPAPRSTPGATSDWSTRSRHCSGSRRTSELLAAIPTLLRCLDTERARFVPTYSCSVPWSSRSTTQVRRRMLFPQQRAHKSDIFCRERGRNFLCSQATASFRSILT
jgi:hypothetical protein